MIPIYVAGPPATSADALTVRNPSDTQVRPAGGPRGVDLSLGGRGGTALLGRAAATVVSFTGSGPVGAEIRAAVKLIAAAGPVLVLTTLHSDDAGLAAIDDSASSGSGREGVAGAMDNYTEGRLLVLIGTTEPRLA